MSEQNEFYAPLRRLGKMFPDKVRHPLVSESEDWDNIIVPALIAWVTSLLQVSEGPRPDTVYMLVPLLRVLSEAIYMLGYERGKHEQQNKGDDLSAFEF